MPRSAATSLARLRRHRGLWALVAVALLIKLVASTLCLTDGAGVRFASSPVPAAAALQLPVDTVASAVDDDSGACLLGEPGGCHCACAHTATLPMAAELAVPLIPIGFDAPATGPSFTPATIGSLLRPPIA